MKIPDFKLEEFWKKYEFSSPYLLCCSDAETWTLSELLAIADEDSKKLWDSLQRKELFHLLSRPYENTR